MTPAATISGQVVDATGRGVRNVVVELRHPWYLEGWRLLADWRELIGRVQGVGKTNLAAVARTNSRGEFRFEDLAPAQYYVRTDFIDEQRAKPINLRAGANASGVKIVTPASGFRKVTGAVLDGNGVPVMSGRISLMRAGVVPLYRMRTLDTANIQNGIFEIITPGPGRYVLLAEAPGRPSPRRGLKEIDVQGTGLLDVRVQVMHGFDITGNATFEGRLPAMAADSDGLSISFYPTFAGAAPVKAATLRLRNGSFVIESVTPGAYRIEILPILSRPFDVGRCLRQIDEPGWQGCSERRSSSGERNQGYPSGRHQHERRNGGRRCRRFSRKARAQCEGRSSPKSSEATTW
jgi:hypothetical protein